MEPTPRQCRGPCLRSTARGPLLAAAAGGRRPKLMGQRPGSRNSAGSRTRAAGPGAPARGVPSSLPPRRLRHPPARRSYCSAKGERRQLEMERPWERSPRLPRRGQGHAAGAAADKASEKRYSGREAPACSFLAPLTSRARAAPAASSRTAKWGSIAAAGSGEGGREEGRRGRRDAVRRDATGSDCKSSRPRRCRGKRLICGGSGSGAAGPVS